MKEQGKKIMETGNTKDVEIDLENIGDKVVGGANNPYEIVGEHFVKKGDKVVIGVPGVKNMKAVQTITTGYQNDYTFHVTGDGKADHMFTLSDRIEWDV